MLRPPGQRTISKVLFRFKQRISLLDVPAVPAWISYHLLRSRASLGFQVAAVLSSMAETLGRFFPIFAL